MMILDDGKNQVVVGRFGRQDGMSLRWMSAHEDCFGRTQGRRLVKNSWIDSELSDVVEKGSNCQASSIKRRKTQIGGERRRQFAYQQTMEIKTFVVFTRRSHPLRYEARLIQKIERNQAQLLEKDQGRQLRCAASDKTRVPAWSDSSGWYLIVEAHSQKRYRGNHTSKRVALHKRS